MKIVDTVINGIEYKDYIALSTIDDVVHYYEVYNAIANQDLANCVKLYLDSNKSFSDVAIHNSVTNIPLAACYQDNTLESFDSILKARFCRFLYAIKHNDTILVNRKGGYFWTNNKPDGKDITKEDLYSYLGTSPKTVDEVNFVYFRGKIYSDSTSHTTICYINKLNEDECVKLIYCKDGRDYGIDNLKLSSTHIYQPILSKQDLDIIENFVVKLRGNYVRH